MKNADELVPTETSRLADAIREQVHALEFLVIRCAEKARKQEQREADAAARLRDVSKLLWMWVAGEHPSLDSEDEFDSWTAEIFVRELATVMGEDIEPSNVQNELQKRADLQREKADPMCRCEHGRSFHEEHGHGRCVGHHAGRPDCVAFWPKQAALNE